MFSLSLSLTFSSFNFLKDTALSGKDPRNDGAGRILAGEGQEMESHGRWKTPTANKEKGEAFVQARVVCVGVYICVCVCVQVCGCEGAYFCVYLTVCLCGCGYETTYINLCVSVCVCVYILVCVCMGVSGLVWVCVWK